MNDDTGKVYDGIYGSKIVSFDVRAMDNEIKQEILKQSKGVTQTPDTFAKAQRERLRKQMLNRPLSATTPRQARKPGHDLSTQELQREIALKKPDPRGEFRLSNLDKMELRATS